MYKHDSELAKDVCRKVGFRFEIHPLEAMKRNEKIYVRGTALKPEEARSLKMKCNENGFVYRGPFGI